MIILQLSSDELSNLIKKAVRAEISEHQSLPDKSPSDDILTVDQTAQFFNLSKSTVYRLISMRELPVMKRGKRCYFLKEDLIDYLKAGRNQSRSEIESESNTYLIKRPEKGGDQ